MWPSGARGAPGVPGLTSTKKFPSRKVRGRIAKVGVGVERKALLVDRDRHVRGRAPGPRPFARAATRHRADALHPADVDARDAHQRVGTQAACVGEGRVDGERIRERIRELGECEIPKHGDHDNRDRPRREGADARGSALAPPHCFALGELRAGRGVTAERLAGRDVGAPVKGGPLVTGRVRVQREVSLLGVELVELLREPTLPGLAVGVAVRIDRGAV